MRLFIWENVCSDLSKVTWNSQRKRSMISLTKPKLKSQVPTLSMGMSIPGRWGPETEIRSPTHEWGMGEVGLGALCWERFKEDKSKCRFESKSDLSRTDYLVIFAQVLGYRAGCWASCQVFAIPGPPIVYPFYYLAIYASMAKWLIELQVGALLGYILGNQDLRSSLNVLEKV